MRIGSYGNVKDRPNRNQTGWVLYHNPRCSKSCQALDLLFAEGIDVKVVEYLNHPLSKTELLGLLSLLKVEAKAILRTKEALAKIPDLNLDDSDAVLSAIAEDSSLLERPIAVHGDRAVVGRPAEKVLELM